jgi:type I restriction enzyme R subunit
MSSGAYKEKTFEAAVEEHLVAHGWHQGDPKNYDRKLAIDPTEFFAFIADTQLNTWEKLIQSAGGDETKTRARVVARLVDELGRRGTIRVLRDGFKDGGVKLDVAYFRDAKGLTPELAARYAANRCTLTRQLPYSPDHHNTLDLTMFVNGLPVATAELKNALSGQTVADAKQQYRVARDPKDQLLSRRAVVHFALDTDLVFLTTKLEKSATRFLPFNRGSQSGGAGNPPHPSGRRSAYLWEEVWQRDAWLDILQRFVHAAGDGGKQPLASAPIIFPRYHQWDAVRRLRDVAANQGPGSAYLIEHSAGSGKSNTIAWLAHQLSTLHDAKHTKVFHKVIVITDRVVLDRQLQGTIRQFDHTPGVVATIDKDSEQLAAALSSKDAQIVVTTLQKFPFVLDQVEALQYRPWAIVVDEAHSSQTGETANALKLALGAGAGTADGTGEIATGDLDLAEAQDAAEEDDNDAELLLARAVETRGRQPNLSWFAFTATPKQKTLELFGSFDPAISQYEPFHLYSMRQAIEEGFILDVLANYVTYKTYYKLASKAAEDLDVDKAKAAAAVARFVSLHPHNLAQKAEVIVEHFRRVTAKKIGGHAKAMVVTRSRLHAVRYKEAIDTYVKAKGYQDHVNALVAFSGQVKADGIEYTEPQMNDGISLKELPRVFGWAPSGNPALDEGHSFYGVLVVAEKYQTGYDQPLLHTMYVDKKLEGVKAVQTLSRLNRTHPGKDDTFVLDFANDADDIQESFKPFFEATLSEPTDPNLLYNAQQAVEDFGLIPQADVDAFVDAFFTWGARAQETKLHASLYQHLDPARVRFEELDGDDRQEFRSALQRFVRLYAFLAQIVPFGDEELEKLYVYCRFLALRLPSEEERGLDLSDDVMLTHLRTELQGTHNLALTDGGDVLAGYRGDASGSQFDPQTAPLSTIIKQLNERFGTQFTKADQLYFDQLEEAMVEDEELQAQAQANTLENFKFGFTKSFEDNVVDRRDANEELFQRLIEDPDFSAVVHGYLMHKVYGRLKDAA